MSSSSDSGKGNSPTPAQQQITPNHLVPVQPEAALLSHGQRRAHYMDFLYRGPVDFDTLVFDTSVGDISPLECYFNRSALGWPGGEVEVKKKKVHRIFLPLMVLGNESQKEF